MNTDPQLHQFSRTPIDPIPHETPTDKSKVVLVGAVAACLFVLSLSGFIGFRLFSKHRAQTQQAHLPTQEELTPSLQDTRPDTPQVAGVSSESAGETTTLTAVAGTDSQTDLNAVCNPQVLFRIGEAETQATDHPADELSWVGALDVVPTYQNPFQIEFNSDADFPWRTDRTQPDTLQTQISFEYKGQQELGTILKLSWSPGTSGSAAKEVSLDGAKVATTPARTGELYTGKSWQQLVFYTENIPMTIAPGQHTLTVRHSQIAPGDESVWDFVELVANCTTPA